MRFYLTKNTWLRKPPGTPCIAWYEDSGRITTLQFFDGTRIHIPANMSRLIDYPQLNP